MGDDVPMQDFTSYMGVLLGNRATREETWTLIQDGWDEVRAKADSPILIRRLIESFSVLPERRHLTEVEAFLTGTRSTARSRRPRRRSSACAWTSPCASG